MPVNKNDMEARRHWRNAYDAIPKSVFAVIAWHLANACSGSCDKPGMAEKRFLEEWETLLDNEFELSRISAKARRILSPPIKDAPQ